MCCDCVTERDDDAIEFIADVVVGALIELDPIAIDAGVTGGVDDPSLDGIEIDEREDVDETGEGIAIEFVAIPLLDAEFVLDVGASKFDIVGECFLLFVDDPPGGCIPGDDTIDCLELGDDTEVEMLVHVVGVLTATVVVTEADLPFGIVTAVLGC